MAFPLTGAGAKHFVDRTLGLTTVSLTVGTEDTNVIDITVQLTDISGNSVSSADAWEAYVVGEAAAAFTLAETGDGTELSNTDRAGLAFTLAADGDATVSVTDVAGASGDTVIVAFRPLDGLSVPEYATVTFD